jgi:3-isopropylmalate dehydrogenase
MSLKLLLLPGDGVGPEVTAQARRVAEWFADARAMPLSIEEALFGGAAYDVHGEPLSDAVIAKAQAADATLMGAVGGPQWANVPFDLRPEAGLLRLRKALGAYANLRPAFCFPALADASPLKRELVEHLDILIVRELVGGVYFGEPRGIETLANGERRGVNTQSYTTGEIRRVARTAFELARARRQRGLPGHVTSAEKANVMESGRLWREEVTRLHAEEFSDVGLSHMYADNCAMQLVRAPRQFDVILTDNLFGDLLSDEAAMLTGSIGMLPSAAIGAAPGSGLYEPVHGSAPDIAGKGVANPLGAILSLEMAFAHSFRRPDDAMLLRLAVEGALNGGARTADLWSAHALTPPLTTSQMGDAVLAELDKRLK